MHTFALTVHTPAEAASLVAGGCGCTDTSPGSFALVAADAPPSPFTWSGILGVENELTGDGRLIEPNASVWENLPIPIRYAPVDSGGHDGAEVVGRILSIERREGGIIWGSGDFDPAAGLGLEAARVVAAGTTRGVSMDLDNVSFEIRVKSEIVDEMNKDLAEDPPQVEPESGEDEAGRVVVYEQAAGDEIMVITQARIRAATIVAIPAFASAFITVDDGVEIPGGMDTEPLVLVAGAVPVEPPAAWFTDPALPGPTPVTVTDDGRIYGHLAVWGTCHTAYSGQCVEPPHSPSSYAHFRLGAVRTAEGTEVPVGRITMDTLHAGRNLSSVDTLAHYEHTGKGVADVAAGEDAYGIWIAGAVRPGLSAEKIRELRSSPLSGDWRRNGGALELVAALAVNVPGFPVPRPQGLVASGAMQSLVASGILTPVPEAEPVGVDPEAIARRAATLAIQGWDRKHRAAALAARVAKPRADMLARRAGIR